MLDWMDYEMTLLKEDTMNGILSRQIACNHDMIYPVYLLDNYEYILQMQFSKSSNSNYKYNPTVQKL